MPKVIAQFPPRRRGIIFITTMWVVLILSALVLVYARAAGVEAQAAANRVSDAQAAAAEKAGEQFVLSQLDGSNGDAVKLTAIQGQQLQVGDGYFWLIRPSMDDAQHQTYDFGLIDECAKVNVNIAPPPLLAKLPFTGGDEASTVSDSIFDWRSPVRSASPDGAESDFYSSLKPPYQCKNGPLETTEELLLVKGVTPQVMYGADLNRNGVLEDGEQQEVGTPGNAQTGALNTAFNGSDASLGLWPYVTIYSKEPVLTADGKPRININTSVANLQVRNVFKGILPANKLAAVEAAITASQKGPGTERGPRQFSSTLQLFYDANLTTQEFDQISDLITTRRGKTASGLININTAPRAVIAALPGLQASDADALIAKRQAANSLDSIAWITEALPREKALAIAPLVTSRSFQYGADVVGVSGDGRSFKRVWIVVDTTTSPASIVYRRDLGMLGWPLDPAVRQSMRRGDGPGALRSGVIGL